MITPKITDSHCHLDFPQFRGELDEILARAKEAGVHRQVTICTTTAGLPGVREIVAQNENVYYAFGIHPLHVHEEPQIEEAQLLTEAKAKKMIAIGETGLDYHYSKETETQQKASLEIHITAAQKTGLPLVIHSRDADDDMAEILTRRYREAPYSCVMHCFSSGKALAQAALDCGFYLSMSGVTTFKNSETLRDIFRQAPIERILVETDAPYLAPVPHRGKRNEPAFAAETARMAASLFDLSYEEFAKHSEANFERLFSRVNA